MSDNEESKNPAPPTTQLFVPLRLDGQDVFLLSADVAAQWKSELGPERFEARFKDVRDADAATLQAPDPKENN